MKSNRPSFLRVIVGALLLAPLSSLPLIGAEGAMAMEKRSRVKVTDGIDKRHSLRAKRAVGAIDLETRAVRLSLALPDGKKGEQVVFVVREPKTGLYCWEHQWLDPSAPSYRRDSVPQFFSNFTFYFLEGALIDFQLNGKNLLVRECHEQQPSFEKALENIIAAIERNVDSLYADPVKGRVDVPLGRPVGADFFSGTKLVAQWRPSKLTDVSRTNGQWSIVIEGPDGERATVILGQDYKVEKVIRKGKVVYPDIKDEEKQQP